MVCHNAAVEIDGTDEGWNDAATEGELACGHGSGTHPYKKVAREASPLRWDWRGMRKKKVLQHAQSCFACRKTQSPVHVAYMTAHLSRTAVFDCSSNDSESCVASSNCLMSACHNDAPCMTASEAVSHRE